MSPGAKVDKDELKKMVVNDVLKRDVVEGVPAEKAKARVKKALSKAAKKSKKKTPGKGSKPADKAHPLAVLPNDKSNQGPFH
jgi:hypothetical protein